MRIVLGVCAVLVVVALVCVWVMFKRSLLTMHDGLIEALAMAPEEFYAARRSGRSLEDLARERGTDTEEIVASIVAGSDSWWLRWVAKTTGTTAP